VDAQSRDTRSVLWIYAVVLAAACACAFGGLSWGLPSTARVERILPAGTFGPDLHEALTASWKKMHGRLGKNLMLNPESFSKLQGHVDVAAGWRQPPSVMLDPIRSFHVRSVHDDEQTLLLILGRMRPRRLQLNPHFFAYGGAYVYPLGGWLGLGAVLGQVPLHTGLAPYLSAPEKMGKMYFWGRLASALAYLGCVFILLEIGRRHLGLWAGVAGAALFLLSPGVIIQAHTMKPHPQWTLFTLWTLLIALDVLRRGSLRSYAWAAVTAGLAVGTVVSAYPACLIIGAASALRIWRQPELWHIDVRRLFCAAVISVAVFFIVNPYWILDSGKVAAEFAVLKGWMTFSPLNPLRIAWGPLRHSLTFPGFALWLMGTAWALWAGRRAPEIMLCAVAVLLVLAPSVMVARVIDVRQVRYFLPAIGIGGLLGGALLSGLWSRLRIVGPVVCLLIFANLAVHAALYVGNFSTTASAVSNHSLAGDWVDKNVPAGSSIGLFRLPAPSNTAYFRYGRYALRLMEHAPFADGRTPYPEYLVLTRPDYDDRKLLGTALEQNYESLKIFPRPQLGWARIHPSATTANPEIEIYKRRSRSQI
jgi:hypothetical protein